MSDTEQKPVPAKPDIAAGCGAAAGIGMVILAVATLMFWPWETEGVVQRVQYNWTSQSTITFNDGRTLQLRGQPTRSLVTGKYYKITYNNLKYFYNVEEVEK